MSDRIFGTNGNSTSTKDQIKLADWDDATSPITITDDTQLTVAGVYHSNLMTPISIKAAGRDDATSLIGSTTTAVESLKRDDKSACSAPEISSYSSDERVYVTVKINPDRYTVNALPSDASQTIAFGPTSFVIRAQDGPYISRPCLCLLGWTRSHLYHAGR
eukprot:scaffold6422_cov69-Cyclotella_meneghiniana.AAC.4